MFDKPNGNPNRRTKFREALLIGAQLHLEDRLIIDAKNIGDFKGNVEQRELGLFVQLSMVNSLSPPDAEEHNSTLLTSTFTTCFTNPEPYRSALTGAEYHEQLFLHIPTHRLTIPRNQSEIFNLPNPQEIFLEYRTPTPSKKGMVYRLVTRRYRVTSDDIAFYTSYDLGERQQDEMDLLLNDPNLLKDALERDSAEVSYAIRAIDTWEETKIKYIHKRTNAEEY